MSSKTTNTFASTPSERAAGKAFQRTGKRKALTEYEKAQEAFQKNFERLRAERLAREAAKANEK